MKKLIFVVLLGILGVTLVGCPEPYKWSCPTLSTQNNEISSNPDKIIISIDGTPSMQGFVSNNNSRYIRTLRLLRNATTTAFPTTPSPDFYIFGTERLNKIESQKAEKHIFYSGSRQELRDAATYRIVEPQKNDPKNSLYVIVTDLYQEKGQWENLVANLKDNYLLKDGYAVGIIAIKSEFKGDIYDVGLNARFYKNIKTNHPFYVLVLGQYSQVKNYFDKIKSGSQERKLNFPDENFVIFSTRVFEQPALLNINENELNIVSSSEKAKLSSTTAQKAANPIQSVIRRVEIINDRNVLVKFNNNSLQNIERLIIDSQNSSNNKKEIILKYNLNYSYLPYTLPLINSLESKINADSDFNQGNKNFQSLDSNSSSIPVSLNDWQFTASDQLQFNAKINLENNPQTLGVYRLIFDIVPETISDKIKPYKAPSWWKTWSFGEQDVFQGNKTYNLEPFLYSLGDTTFRIIENKPEFALGRLCFVIQKK